MDNFCRRLYGPVARGYGVAMKALAPIVGIVALALCSPVVAEAAPYRALLVHCLAPGQCIVISIGEFATIPECQARLELVRKFKIMGRGGERVGVRADRAFCALPTMGKKDLEGLDFIRRHYDELAPYLEAIERREKAVAPD